MSAKPKSSPIFWLSFLPALAYWWLEENTSLQVALIGGIGLSVLEIIFERVFTGHVHTLSKLNFGLIVVLGGVSLLAQEGIWFKLQPTFTGIILALFLGIGLWRGKSFLEQVMQDMGRPWPLPRPLLIRFELHLCLFIMSYALFMSYWAFYGSTSQWAFWKTGGQYLCFALFGLLQMLWLRWELKKMTRNP